KIISTRSWMLKLETLPTQINENKQLVATDFLLSATHHTTTTMAKASKTMESASTTSLPSSCLQDHQISLWASPNRNPKFRPNCHSSSSSSCSSFHSVLSLRLFLCQSPMTAHTLQLLIPLVPHTLPHP